MPGLRELQEHFSSDPLSVLPKTKPCSYFHGNQILAFLSTFIYFPTFFEMCDDFLSSNVSLEFSLTFYFGGFLNILVFTILDLVKIQLISTFTLHTIGETQNILTWLLTFQITWCLCDIVLYLYCVCMFAYFNSTCHSNFKKWI